jgi:hypothetical protein
MRSDFLKYGDLPPLFRGDSSPSNDAMRLLESARSRLAPAVKPVFVFGTFQNLDGDKSPAESGDAPPSEI